MPRSNLIKKSIHLCREQRHCTPFDLAIWLEISVSTLEKLWKILKEMCSRGALDTENLKCVYNPLVDALEFEEKVR